MKKAKSLRINPVVSCGPEEEGAILFNPDTDNTAIINFSGQLIWDFLENPHSVKEISCYLQEKYEEVSIEEAQEDVTRFIDSLKPDFLLEVSDYAK